MRIASLAGISAFACAIFGSAASAQPAETVGQDIQFIELGAPIGDGVLRRATASEEGLDWEQPGDYPAEAVTARREGQIWVEIAIGADDRPGICTVKQSQAIVTQDERYRLQPGSADPALEKAACALLATRGSFRHALGQDGSPLPGAVGFQVNFVLLPPGRGQFFSPPPPAPPQFRERAKPRAGDAIIVRNVPVDDAARRRPAVSLAISEKGHVTRCRVFRTTGTDAGDMAMCRQAAQAEFLPARDLRGKQVASDFQLFFPQFAP